MRAYRVAHNYAHALLQLAIAQKSSDAVVEAVQQLLTVCQQPKVREAIGSPLYSTAQKITVLQKLLPGKTLPPLVKEFLKLVLDKKRASVLAEILHTFIELNDSHQEHQTAYLTTAVPLPKQLIPAFEAMVKELAACKTVKLINKVRPQLIGGYQLQVKDRLIDVSLATKLHQLYQQMALPHN